MAKSMEEQTEEVQRKMGITSAKAQVAEQAPVDPLEVLFSQTYMQALSGDREIELRRLPFATVSFALGVITRSAQVEIMAVRNSFASALQKATDAVSDAGGTAAFMKGDGATQMITIFAPLLQTLATTVPMITDQILKDCVVGLNPAMVDMIPLEDGLTIISSVILHTDRALIARQLNDVFLAVAEVVENLTTSAEDQGNL